jgi:hypothetical protein
MSYNEDEVRRIARVGFETAMARGKKLCSVDKANVLETSQLWRDVVIETHAEYPQVALSHMYVDNCAMQLVRDPGQFDVILTGNLFGDILSDQAAMLTGSIGMLASASLGAFLLEAVRSAYTISGAVDEDHRQLSQTEEEVGRTMVSVERLRVETTEDVARHTAYAGRERANLVALGAAVRTGEFLGPGLASRTIDTAPQARPADAAAARPIVVVRFDRPNPVFEQSLYAAATRALEVRPQVSFDVVGIAAGGNQGARAGTATAEARRQAEQVMRVLVEMGMPAQRVRMSTRSDATLTANEVHVLAR